jgi:glycosyltransferase involved in cell wall biosynthesis
MSTPVVSIVTPCLNSARFLPSCLASVQAQVYPHVEHVVQDGNSTDRSVDILRGAPGNVRWVSEPDRSQADALDRALRRSRGDVLLVLNADDELLPGAARWAVEQMQRYPALGVIYGDLYLMGEDGVLIGEFRGPAYDFAGVFCVEKIIPAQAAFIRRSALEKVGLWADASLDTCPDYEMFVRLGLRFPMRHIRGFVAKYRYYQRPMDGLAPRTVERFIRAKSTVIQRVLADPETPVSIKKLDRRARAGLSLWASEEARVVGDSRRAWTYYADALSEFGPAGFVLARLIRLRLRFALQCAPRLPYPTRPNVGRALSVGKALLKERPRLVALVRILRAFRRALYRTGSAFSRTAPVVLPLLIMLAVLYLLVVIASRR